MERVGGGREEGGGGGRARLQLAPLTGALPELLLEGCAQRLRLLGRAAEQRVGRVHARALVRRRVQLSRSGVVGLDHGELPLQRAHAHRFPEHRRL